MKKKGRSKAAGPTPAGPGILKLATLALAFCLIVIVALGGSVLSRFESGILAVENASLARASGRLAGEINGWVRLIETFAADSDVVSAFGEGRLPEMERTLAARIPDARAVRLFPSGPVLLDEDGELPLGYAALELIQAAEKGATPPVEVHMPASEQARLVVARPVRDGSGVVGTLLVAFKPELLGKWLVAAADGAGHYELSQPGSPVLASVGSTPGGSGAAPVREPVVGTGLVLAFTPKVSTGPAETDQGARLVMILGGIALATAIAFAALALVLRRWLKEDLLHFATFVERRTQGRTTIINMRLVEVRALAYALQAKAKPEPKQFPDPRATAAADNAPKPVAGAAAPDQPNSLLFMERSGVEVEEVEHPDEKPVVADAAPEPVSGGDGPGEADETARVPVSGQADAALSGIDHTSGPEPEPTAGLADTTDESIGDQNILDADAPDQETILESDLIEEVEAAPEPVADEPEDNLLEFEFDMESFRAERAEPPAEPEPTASDDEHSVTFELDPALLEGMEDETVVESDEERKKKGNS